MARLRRTDAPRFAGRGRIRRKLAVVSVLGMAVLPLQGLGAVDASAATPLVTDPAALVNPLIGTSGEVDTFPGPDMPFGMLQWGPDTTPDRALGGGYEYKDSKISGFSLTHLSGPGCSAGGDVPILPVTGALTGNLGNTTAGFQHADEHTGIGYYGVTDSSGITSELTTTTRAGLGRFTFPGSNDSSLLLKLSGGATRIDGTRAQIVNDHEVVGAVQSGHFCGAANTYTLHFDIKFDQPFTDSGTWVGGTVNPDATRLKLGRPKQTLNSHPDKPSPEPHFTVPAAPSPTVHRTSPKATRAQGGAPVTGANGMYLTFDTTTAKTVTAAVGISYTSDANAADEPLHGGHRLGLRRHAAGQPRRLEQGPGPGADRRRQPATSRCSSTPRSTTRCCTPTSSPTTTASTWAWTTRSTSWPPGRRRSTPTTRAGTPTARRPS